MFAVLVDVLLDPSVQYHVNIKDDFLMTDFN